MSKIVNEISKFKQNDKYFLLNQLLVLPLQCFPRETKTI
jgi:hypothetical protein